LFDVGFGVVSSLRENGFDVADIDTLIISHLHPDHIGDALYFLIRCWQQHVRHGVDKPLTIIGPVGTKEIINAYHNLANGIDNKDEIRDLIKWTDNVIENIIELSDGETHENEKIKVDTFSVSHSTKLNCNGYIITTDNARIGCSGDTSYCRSIKENIKNAKTWIIDASHVKERNSPRHISLEKIFELASMYPDTKFYCVHRNDYEIPELPPNVFCPADNELVVIKTS
jgi:ribonuclease BN (tRNA processing enzyme)